MMGEFIIYYRGKVIGGIYDNRFLVKPVESAKLMMPDAHYEVPYEGASDVSAAAGRKEKEVSKQGFAGGIICGWFQDWHRSSLLF